MRLDDDGKDCVLAAYAARGDEYICLASRLGNVLCFPVLEATLLKGAGKGLTAIKLKPDDEVFAFELSPWSDKGPLVLTALGREEVVRPTKFVGARAAKGYAVFRRGNFALWKRPADIRMGRPPEGEA